MEVTSEEQVEQGLGSRMPPKVLSFALRVELAARAFGPALALHLQRVVMGLCASAYHGTVPLVSVSPLREDGRAPVEADSLRATDFGSSHICLHNEVSNRRRRLAPGYVRQNLVETLELFSACCISADPSVLPQHAKREITGYGGVYNEWRFACGRGQLLEITEQNDVHLPKRILHSCFRIGPAIVVYDAEQVRNCRPASGVDHGHFVKQQHFHLHQSEDLDIVQVR